MYVQKYLKSSDLSFILQKSSFLNVVADVDLLFTASFLL